MQKIEPRRRRVRDLKDTPFSIERLFVWAVGIVLLLGVIGIIILSLSGKTIPPQLQSIVMISLGAFIARIEKKINW